MITIVTSHWKENLDFLKDSKFPVVLIDKQWAEPSWLKPQHVIPNRGREASVYLKYIIENYENLPDHVAFIHGHETAYHQFHEKPLLEMIEGANIEKYEFISLNNWMRSYSFSNEMTNPSNMQILEKCVDYEMSMDYLPPFYTVINIPIGAQFVVSRKRLQKHSHETYEKWYNKLMEDSDIHSAVFFEHMWWILLGDGIFKLDCPKDWFKFETSTPVWFHDYHKLSAPQDISVEKVNEMLKTMTYEQVNEEYLIPRGYGIVKNV